MPYPASPSASPRPHHVIHSIEVTGGFLKGAKIDFADGINCLIGGRGSGKSTVVALLRFAFGAAPASPGQAKIFDGMLRRNLGAGRVRVHVETKHGVRYVVERCLGRAPQVFTADGELVNVLLDSGLFAIEAYGQDEIENVAADRSSQLALIDGFAHEELRSIAEQIDDEERALLSGANELLRIEAEIASLEDRVSEVRAIEEQLRPLEQGMGPDAALVSAAHAQTARRKREEEAAVMALASAGSLRKMLPTVHATLVPEFTAEIPDDLCEGINGEILRAIRHEVDLTTRAVELATRLMEARCAAAEAALETLVRALTVKHAKQEAIYEGLIAKQNEEDSRVAERTRLQLRRSELASAPAHLDARRRDHQNRMRERAEQLAELAELRDRRFHARDKIARSLSGQLEGVVRVSISQSENLDAYRAVLGEALGDLTNNRPKKFVDKLVAMMPDDLAALVRRRDCAALTARTGFEPDRTNQVIDALSPSHRLFAIDATPMDDVVRIEIKHGQAWKDSTEASPGQRCGAILPILLLQAERPLVIDQPEDNVDPDFMCNVILPKVESLKGARQFVFASHHANVPVLPNAECVIEIGSDGPQGWPESAGNVESQSAPILRWLEGGRAAFERRRERYA